MNMNKALNYVRANLTRFLLLAVVLTSGTSMHLAAQAKYVDYLTQNTSAVAGDFCFTSNLLGTPEDARTYQISGFNGLNYKVPLELRGFENAMRYNKVGTDLCFYLTASLQTESGRSVENYTATFSDASNSHVGTYRNSWWDPEYKVWMIRGSDTYNKENTQVVDLSVELNVKATESLILTVDAYVVPVSRADNISFVNNTYSGDQYKKQTGVFAKRLTASFVLKVEQGDLDLRHEIETSNTDYMVSYKLVCESAPANSRMRLCYDAEKLTPDLSLGGYRQ